MDATRENAEVRPAAGIAGLTAYRPPAFEPGVDLRLDANEGPAPTPEVMAVLGGVGAERLRRYPDAGELEGWIAARWGVGAGRVVVTNGGDDAIDRLCRAVLEPGRTLVTHGPTFEMIGRGARLVGASVREERWVGGACPVAGMAGAIDGSTGLVAVVSPNNPTGGVATPGEIVELASAARRVGAVLLVDLAYVEFADEDPTGELLGFENVVIVRTFSKAYGLAGLRVGYAIAPPRIAEWLRITGGPYPVSGVSLALAGAAYADGAAGRGAYLARVRRERAELETLLGRKGARVLGSQANFVSAYVGDAFGLRAQLAAAGIAVRAFRGGGDLANLVRITLPGEAGAFDRLVRAIGEIKEVWS